MQLRKIAKKSAQCSYDRAGIKPKIYSNYEYLKSNSRNFRWNVQ